MINNDIKIKKNNLQTKKFEHYCRFWFYVKNNIGYPLTVPLYFDSFYV
jgi:hypothetical protein